APARRVVGGPEPRTSHVETVAEWLAAARHPVSVTTHVGRDLGAGAALADAAEACAIPVVEAAATCVNLPASHPMRVGPAGGALLEQADVIVVVDSEVPWFPRQFSPAPGVKVAHLGIDPLWTRYPIRSFPADVVIPGCSRTSLRMLADALALQRPDQAVVDARRTEIARLKAEQQ